MDNHMNRRKGLARRSFAPVEALEPRQLLTIAFPVYLLGSEDGISPIASAADPDGNVVILGNLSGVADFNPSSRKTHLIDGGDDSYFLAKYDPSGKLLFAFSLGEDVTASTDLQAITSDRAGNFYISGTLFGEIDADPGRKVRTRAPESGADVIVFRFNNDGAFLAAGTEAIPDGDILTADQLKVDANGNAFVAGTYGDDTAPEAFLSKFGKSGAAAWWTNGIDATDVTLGLDRNQAPALVGRTGTTGSIAITRYTGVGRYVSRQVLSENAAQGGTIEPVSLDFDKGNCPIIAGNLTGYADFDPTQNAAVRGPVLANEPFSNIFLARYTSKGVLSYAQVIGGHAADKTAGAVVDPISGNVFLTGSFNGDTDFDPGTGAYMMTTLNNNFVDDAPSDLFIAKYVATTGKFLTAAQLESHNLRDDAVTMAFAPLTATSSRIYVFGMSTGFRAGKEAISIFETVR
jgi:hypothetical protein